jgi:predicted site-specific integrase-resolvase
MAGVSRSTVARWKDDGRLVPEEVNGLRLYRESVVKDFLRKLERAKR